MPLDPTCWHTVEACLCADLDKMPVSEIEKYLERRKARRIEAVARHAEQDKAPREGPPCVRCPLCPYSATGWMGRVGEQCPNGDGGVLVADGAGYADRRAAGEGGHGMADPWRPTVGARVVTAAKLATWEPSVWSQFRRPRALGVALGITNEMWMVRHGDGNVGYYDADELRPAPEAAK